MLKFLPTEGSMPFEPYVPMAVGQRPRYLGRKFNSKTGEYEIAKPFECEPGSKAAMRCAKFVRRGEAVPANAEAAAFTGVVLKVPKQSKGSANASSAADKGSDK